MPRKYNYISFRFYNPSWRIRNFIKQLQIRTAKAAKDFAIKVANSPTGALELTAVLSTAADIENSKAIAATSPFNIEFCHQRKAFVFTKETKIMVDCRNFSIHIFLIKIPEDYEKESKIKTLKRTHQKNWKKTQETRFSSWYGKKVLTANGQEKKSAEETIKAKRTEKVKLDIMFLNGLKNYEITQTNNKVVTEIIFSNAEDDKSPRVFSDLIDFWN